ncbi:MAG: hypothetical protein ACLFV7_01545 [Phycisphaerae bacterium]
MTRFRDMRRLAVLAVVLVAAGTVNGQVAVGGGGVRAPMRIHTPLSTEQVVTEGERVVVGEVVEAGEPNEMKVTLPGKSEAVKATFVKYTVRVEETLKPKPKKEDSQGDTSGGEKITVWAFGRPLRRVRGGGNVNVQVRGPIRVVVQGGGGKKVVLGPGQGGNINPQAAKAAPRTGPLLRTGGKYVFVLKRMAPGKDEYYLEPAYPWWSVANDVTISQYKTAADVEKWAWGKAVKGLQLAVLPGRTTKLMTLRGKVSTPLPLALRNSGDETIELYLENPTDLFGVKATDADGNSVDGEFLTKKLAARRTEAEDGNAPLSLTIKPGEIRFLNWGDAGYPGMIRLPIKQGGKWNIEVTYSVKAEGKAVSEPSKCWSGQVTSGKLEKEIVAPFRGVDRPRPMPMSGQ